MDWGLHTRGWLALPPPLPLAEALSRLGSGSRAHTWGAPEVKPHCRACLCGGHCLSAPIGQRCGVCARGGFRARAPWHSGAERCGAKLIACRPCPVGRLWLPLPPAARVSLVPTLRGCAVLHRPHECPAESHRWAVARAGSHGDGLAPTGSPHGGDEQPRAHGPADQPSRAAAARVGRDGSSRHLRPSTAQ